MVVSWPGVHPSTALSFPISPRGPKYEAKKGFAEDHNEGKNSLPFDTRPEQQLPTTSAAAEYHAAAFHERENDVARDKRVGLGNHARGWQFRLHDGAPDFDGDGD